MAVIGAVRVGEREILIIEEDKSAPVYGCQTPKARRQELNRAVLKFECQRRIKEIRNMLKHGENWFLPIYESDHKHLRFLLARARHELKLRQNKNNIKKLDKQARIEREKYLAKIRPEIIESKISRLTGMDIGPGKDEECDEHIEFITTPRPLRRPRVVELSPWVDNLHFSQPEVAPRNEALLLSLRVKISLLRQKRSKKIKSVIKSMTFEQYVLREWNKRWRYYKYQPKAEHQGNDEDAHGPDESQIQDQASNVVLERQTEESEGIAPSISTDYSFNLSTNDPQLQYDSFLDRFIHIKTLTWDNTKHQGDTLFEECFPLFFIVNREHTPNASFFKLFQYWKGDMEFKIQINSNPFQVGQLQCSWRYMDFVNGNIDHYKNVHTLSQGTHCLISANTNNAGKLFVPYKYIKSSIGTTKRPDQDVCLNMGCLRIKVLNQLFATSNSFHAVDVSIWVRFLNGRFSGMKASDIGEHQGILDDIKQAEFHLNMDARIDNTDKPPVQIAKEPVVISSNQSFCLGTNITEPLNPLRLDARGQSRNIENLSSETKISKLARTFGFVKTFTWSAQDTSTKLLTTIDASPMFNLNEYQQGTIKGDRYFHLPPVAIISEQFLYWRGSLEMRLDVIATDFHRGKLMVAYIPRELGDVTYTQALSSPHVVFDLRDNKQFSMVIPWITNVHYWSRRYGYRSSDSDVSPPGKIHIFIQNRLVPMDNVRDRVDINLYWRGGSDFSVAVPALSALSLPWNAMDNTKNPEVRAYEGYYPYYVGSWRNFGTANRAILRYGKGMDHVAQFEGFGTDTWKTYYVYKGKTPLKCNVYSQDDDGKQVIQLKEFKYGVFVELDGYHYMAMATTTDEVENYLDYLHYPTYKKMAYEALPIVDDKDLGNFGGEENPLWDSVAYTPQPPSADYVYLADHQGDEHTLESPPATLVYNQFYESGNNVFGENFTDFKDLARRYQPYSLISFSAGDATAVDALLPVQPWGLPIENLQYSQRAQRPYHIYNREGFIPILCSAYQFFRGGLRFRLVFNAGKNDGRNCFVAHFPEKHDIKNLTTPAAGTIDSVFFSNYGFYVQSINVNNVVEYEIPYYLPLNSIYPNPAKDEIKEVCDATNLGCMAIGLTTGKEAKGVLYYSFADDSHLSCFQGWPCMILRSRGYAGEHQGLGDWLSETVLNKPLNVKVDLGIEQILALPEVQDLKKLLKDVASTTVEDILFQIGHIVLHPEPRTIAWSIVTILTQLRIFKIQFVTKCMTPFIKLAKYFSSYWDSDNQPDKPTTSQSATAEHQGIDEEETNLFAEIVALILSVLGLCLGMSVPTDIRKGNYLHLFKSFFSGIMGVSRNYQRVVAFIAACVKLVQKLIRLIILWKNPDQAFEVMAQEDMPTLHLWTIEAFELLNIKNEDRVYTLGSTWANRMEICYMLGCRIHQAITQYKGTRFDPKLFHTFNQLFKQICEKRDNMYRRGASVVSRKDPYCVYIAGSPGIGKSVVASDLAIKMLKQAQIPIQGEPIFTLPNGAKYWNGCRNQPCILIDDFLCVNNGTIQEEAIRAFMEIKSPAVLNPPMAHLQDKELRYAPELMIVLSNSHFPVVNHANLEAIYRRRDALIDVELCDELQEAGIRRISNFTSDELAMFRIDLTKFEHLKARLAGDVTGGQTDTESASEEGAQWSPWRGWNRIASRVTEDFLEHRDNQEKLYAKRVAALQELLDEDLEVHADLDSKLKEYTHLINMLSILKPKENCDFKQYLYLIQQAANGFPISEELLERLVIINAEVSRKFRAEQDKIHQDNDLRRENEHQGMETYQQEFVDSDGSSCFISYILGANYCEYKKIYPVKILSKRAEKASKTLLLEAETVRSIHQTSHRLQMALEHHNLKASVEYFPHTSKDPHGEIVITVEDIENAKNVDFDKDDPESNQPLLNPYYNVLYSVIQNPDFKYGCEQYDKLVHHIDWVLRLMCPADNPGFDNLIRIINSVSHSFRSQGNVKMYHFMNQIVSQLSEHGDVCDMFGRLIGYRNILNSMHTMSIVLGFVIIILMKDMTEQQMLKIIETTDTSFNINLAQISDTIQKIVLGTLVDCGFPTTLEEIRVASGLNNYKPFDCPHMWFSPASSWFEKGWTNVSVGPSNVITMNYAPDEVCDKDARDKLGNPYKNRCPWATKFWYRSCMNWWKECNPTQVSRLKKLKDEEKPKCLSSGAENTDYRWYEKLWAIIKDVKNILCQLGKAILPILALLLATLIVLWRVLAFLYAAFKFIMALIHVCKGGSFYDVYSDLPRWVDPWGTTADYSTKFGSKSQPSSNKNVFTEHENVYNGKASQPKGSKKERFSNFFKPQANHEGILDDGNHIGKAVLNNTIYVSVPGSAGVNKALGLGDRYIIFMKHYYEMYKNLNVTHLNFQRHGTTIINTYALDDLDFIIKDENSTCICKLPKSYQPLKNIVKRFQPLHQWTQVPQEPVFFDVQKEGIMTRSLTVQRIPSVVIAATATQSEQELTDLWRYDYGGKGKCGSPIVDMNRGCIIGIHVAGKDDKIGYGEIFCKESFEALFTKDTIDLQDPDYVIEKDNPPPKLKGQFEYFGEVETGLEQHQSSDTQLEPSLISGVFPACREPAPLGNRDPRLPEGSSPLYDGVNNMLLPSLPFQSKFLKSAQEDLLHELITKCKPYVRKPECILSYKEVILGIDGVKYYDGLDMSTSEGYPMSRFRPPNESSKRWLFDIPDDRKSIGINKDLLSIMEKDQSNRLQGIMNPIVHDDCLKDALIPSEKCRIPGKTRIFSISPVQFTIQFKQYFGHFLAAFKNSRLNLEHAVGINPNGPEWMLALRYLTSKGTKFLCGDYSNFGPTLEINCLTAAFELINGWYSYYNGSSTHNKIRTIMGKEVSHAMHLCYKHLYRVPGGMPSGNPATVELNSLVNMLYIRVAWLEIMNQGEYRVFLDEYHINVSTLVYGDDIIMCVSDKVIDTFNNESLQNFFAKYLIKYTSADKKTGKIQPYVSLEEASFLKRGFRKHPKLMCEFLAPLPEDIVCDTANWIHRCDDRREATRINAVACCAEAYGLGPVKYEQIRQKIWGALSEKGITTYIRSWDEWDEIHFKDYFSYKPLAENKLTASSFDQIDLESEFQALNLIGNQKKLLQIYQS